MFGHLDDAVWEAWQSGQSQPRGSEEWKRFSDWCVATAEAAVRRDCRTRVQRVRDDLLARRTALDIEIAKAGVVEASLMYGTTSDWTERYRRFMESHPWRRAHAHRVRGSDQGLSASGQCVQSPAQVRG